MEALCTERNYRYRYSHFLHSLLKSLLTKSGFCEFPIPHEFLCDFLLKPLLRKITYDNIAIMLTPKGAYLYNTRLFVSLSQFSFMGLKMENFIEEFQEIQEIRVIDNNAWSSQIFCLRLISVIERDCPVCDRFDSGRSGAYEK